MKTRKLFNTIIIILIASIKLQAQSPMKAMSKYTGSWKAEFMMWMDPVQPPMKDQLTVQREMIMNGLFLSSRYTGYSMGMNYEGISTIGYSMEKKKYVSSWIDNMNSGISYMEGTASSDGKSIEFHGTATDAVTGKDILMRQVLTFVDETHQKIEIFVTKDGNEVKTIEFNLTKQ
ncbi:MAG TPA: DUF1579 domain-containing protein [Chitinophagales bacterium]|nr:DUF1579 domain-containing protein [Chitinophagales bacterium]